jgi:hypothetical protein
MSVLKRDTTRVKLTTAGGELEKASADVAGMIGQLTAAWSAMEGAEVSERARAAFCLLRAARHLCSLRLATCDLVLGAWCLVLATHN